MNIVCIYNLRVELFSKKYYVKKNFYQTQTYSKSYDQGHTILMVY